MMVMPNERFALNDVDVAAEVIEDDAVLVNLATGMYYSMDGPAGLIWSMVQQRCTVRDVVDAVVARYAVTHEQAHADVVHLLEELRREELIVQVAEGPAAADPVPLAARHSYVQPRLQAFDNVRFTPDYS